MSKRSNTSGENMQSQPQSKKLKTGARTVGYLLLTAIAFLQILGIVQSVSIADTLFHGAFLLALIAVATKKKKDFAHASKEN